MDAEHSSPIKGDELHLAKDLGKHNIRSASRGSWTLIMWTDAAIYPPGFPINIFLRLVPKDQQAQGPPDVITKIRVIPVVSDGFSREADPAPSFRVVKRELVGWEMEVRDVFNSSIPPPYEATRPGADALQRGAYLISIYLKVDDTSFEIEDVPIAVLRKADTNTFWKTNPDRIGDFLPQLNEETQKRRESSSQR